MDEPVIIIRRNYQLDCWAIKGLGSHGDTPIDPIKTADGSVRGHYSNDLPFDVVARSMMTRAPGIKIRFEMT